MQWDGSGTQRSIQRQSGWIAAKLTEFAYHECQIRSGTGHEVHEALNSSLVAMLIRLYSDRTRRLDRLVAIYWSSNSDALLHSVLLMKYPFDILSLFNSESIPDAMILGIKDPWCDLRSTLWLRVLICWNVGFRPMYQRGNALQFPKLDYGNCSDFAGLPGQIAYRIVAN